MLYSMKLYKATLFMATVAVVLIIANTILTIRNTQRLDELTQTFEEWDPVIVTKVNVMEAQKPEEQTTVEETSVRIDCPLDEQTQQMILNRCEELDLDFSLVMGVIFRESSFRPNADSGSSVGLMQINRSNHEWLSSELGITDFFDPEQNVIAGTYMLNLLFDKYDDPAMVLMAYNMGETGAGRLWKKGIYTSDYAEDILQQADKYDAEIAERMGANVLY